VSLQQRHALQRLTAKASDECHAESRFRSATLHDFLLAWRQSIEGCGQLDLPLTPLTTCSAYMQGVTVALGLLACGAAAWGMASLDKNILPALNARIDSMQEFPSRVVQQVASLANETAALNQPLSNISTIISSIDAAGIREDLQHVTAFLKEAPSPTALKATLQQLSSALKPQLYEGLRQLHAQVNVASDSSPLAALKGYLDTLADFDISTMGPAISSYNDALAALFDTIVSDRWVGAAGASRALVTNLPHLSDFTQLGSSGLHCPYQLGPI